MATNHADAKVSWLQRLEHLLVEYSCDPEDETDDKGEIRISRCSRLGLD